MLGVGVVRIFGSAEFSTAGFGEGAPNLQALDSYRQWPGMWSCRGTVLSDLEGSHCTMCCVDVTDLQSPRFYTCRSVIAILGSATPAGADFSDPADGGTK